MDERGRRIGLNEALFREVNDRLEDLNEAFAPITGTINLICECGDAGCTERILMPQSQYRELRSDPTLFAVVPGHEAAEVEEVVQHGEQYDVIRKKPGAPARLAEVTDAQ